MAITKAKIGYTAYLERETGSPPQYERLGEIRSISGIGVTRNQHDVTHTESPNGWEENIQGIRRGKTVSVQLNLTDESIDILDLVEDSATENYRVVYPQLGYRRTFPAIPIDWDDGNVAPDDPMVGTLQLKTAGPIVTTAIP